MKNVKNLSSNEGNVQFLGKDVQNTTDIQNAELFSPKVEADTKLNKESISVSSKAAVRIQNNNCNNNNNPPANYRKGVVPKYDIKINACILNSEKQLQVNKLENPGFFSIKMKEGLNQYNKYCLR